MYSISAIDLKLQKKNIHDPVCRNVTYMECEIMRAKDTKNQP